MDAQKWKDFYLKNRKENSNKIFIKVMTSDGKHFFFTNDQFDTWLEVKKRCDEDKVRVQDLHFQFRSHKCVINLDDAEEGLYLIRSVLGAVGMPTKDYFTVGKIKGGKVYKEMWLVPELIKDQEYTERLSDCFTEAVIHYETKKKNRKE